MISWPRPQWLSNATRNAEQNSQDQFDLNKLDEIIKTDLNQLQKMCQVSAIFSYKKKLNLMTNKIEIETNLSKNCDISLVEHRYIIQSCIIF